MHLHFENKTRKQVDTRLLELYVKKAEKLLDKRLKTYCPKGAKVNDLGLDIFFVSDKEIQRINKEYRGKDKPTDVISFSYVEDRNFMPFVKGVIFTAGEIFMSLDTIARQAKEKGLERDDEMVYMLIHGFLHVFGHDHETDREERDMEKASFQILGKLYPRKDEFGF